LDHIFDRVIYGESLLTGSRTEADRFNESALQHDNLLGKPIRHYDTGGVIETPEYDFKGQPVFTTRKLFKKYKEVANWIDTRLSSDLEAEEFTFTTETDALGRITKQTTPDKSVITPAYNATGLLKAEKVSLFDFKSGLPGASSDYIKLIDYNEKGQRNKIIYGNDVTTKFTYDDKNFRLKRLETVPKNTAALNSDKGCEQDWHYTFDAVGNITQIEDKKIPVVFFDNQKTTGISEYTYDALYRLRMATGRENHVALSSNHKDNSNDVSFINQLSAGDPMSMRNYTQKYSYDSVGNMTQMKHEATDNNWTRNYTYEAFNNRLTKTEVGAETFSYTHHAHHGYMLTMPHLEDLGWNFKEELVKSIKQKVSPGNGTAESTYYQYDGSGQRIRKITESQAAAGQQPTRKEERIYIAGFETYKTYEADAVNFERVSLSLMDQGHRFVMVERVGRNKASAPVAPNRVGDTLIRYQLHNHQGSAALELDESARVISYEKYHPFGTTANQANNKAIKAAAKRYRYTGMERDEETGLEYHSARYYVPWLGRWLSADKIGIGDGVNMYGYCKGNPLRLLDLNGKQATMPDAHVGGDIGELSLAQYFDSQDDLFEVVYDATKSGSQHGPGGFDMIVLNKSTGEVMIIDNKAYQGTIRNVSAFSPQNFKKNLASAIDEVSAGASAYTDEILASLESGNVKKVVANSFSSGNAGFSADVFNDVDEIFDVRTGAFYKSIDDWKAAASAWKTTTKLSSTTGSVGTGRRIANVTEAVTSNGKIVTQIKPSAKLLAALGTVAVLLKPAAAYAGYAGDLVEISLGGKAVADAPIEQRPQVAMEETAGFVGGAAGTTLGATAGGAGAGLIAGALGLSGPPGWLVLGLGIIGGGLGGYGGSEGGRAAVKSTLETAKEMYNETERGIYNLYGVPYF